MSSMNVIISPISNESSSSLLATYLNEATNCFVFGFGFNGAGGGGYKEIFISSFVKNTFLSFLSASAIFVAKLSGNIPVRPFRSPSSHPEK